MFRLAFLFSVLVCGCSFATNNLQSGAAQDLEARGIRRIAVLTSGGPNDPRSRAPFTVGEARPGEREAPEFFNRLVYATMAGMSNWQIVSESEVREVDVGAPSGSEAARLKQLGEIVYADAIMSGSILRFRQRIGDDWGAQSPASVAFILQLIDIRRGDVVWTARFDETQKSISENAFGIFQIGERGLRWLSAEELTTEGVKKAISQLHQLMFKTPN